MDNTDLFGICPYVTAQKLISGKWAVLVLHYLEEGTHRFGALQKKIPNLTQATLTKQLRLLEGYGLIERRVYPEVPPKVEYSLTSMGRKFKPVLDAVEQFGQEYIQSMVKTDK